LKVKVPGSANIRNSRNPAYVDTEMKRGETRANAVTMAAFGAAHEDYFQMPIVDRTGLSGKYDLALDWESSTDPAENAARIKQALLDQLGLELVPARDRIEVLVVERAPK
jgi:uncharacterized protein (TIGR03435 family)